MNTSLPIDDQNEQPRSTKQPARRNGLHPAKVPTLKKFQPIPCPCCRRAVTVPDVDIIIDHYSIPRMEAAILRAIWRSKGEPVPTERIYEFMYADYPERRPASGNMYRAFKVALHHLRTRLVGSGVGIVNVGYEQGYALVLGEH